MDRESAKLFERANRHESTIEPERAIVNESTSARERERMNQ